MITHLVIEGEHRPFFSIIDPIATTFSFGILQRKVCRIPKEGLTWQAGWSNQASPTTHLAQVRAKVVCWGLKSSNNPLLKPSTTRIPTSGITGCHPWPTGGLVKGGVYPSAKGQSAYPTDPANRARNNSEAVSWTIHFLNW